nr:ribonuclease H-like domain, reverse transcriptase, RNA-dependent DNA polymerase [Tanacetum cinerariifolium]
MVADDGSGVVTKVMMAYDGSVVGVVFGRGDGGVVMMLVDWWLVEVAGGLWCVGSGGGRRMLAEGGDEVTMLMCLRWSDRSGGSVMEGRFSWVYFLKSKDETTPILKNFIRQAENQFNHKVKTTRSDNETKFKNSELIEFYGLKGINREYSSAKTPQQNGVADRKNMALIEAARTIIPIITVGPSRTFSDGKLSYPDDPSMPHLEDIYARSSEGIFNNSSYDDEGVNVWILVDLPFGKKAIGTKWVYRNKKDERGVVVRNKARLVAEGYRKEEGIDYNEVFAPVARIKAIRIFLAFSSYMGLIVYKIDVKSAFMYGTIDEEVYVTQPPGFVDPKFPNKVYKVVKDLYVYTKLLELGMLLCLLSWSKMSWCDEFEELMKNRFQMSSMGELTFFFGLQTASTPIETQKPLVKDKEATDVDVHLYRSMIGSLMYLTASRLGIMFVVCACSRFQYALIVNPTIYVLCIKQFWATVLIKANDVVKLQALIDRKKVVITEVVIRQDLCLDDADGVECLPNEEILHNLHAWVIRSHLLS